jgi:hypothetical protein
MRVAPYVTLISIKINISPVLIVRVSGTALYERVMMPNFNDLCLVRDKAMRALVDARVLAQNARDAADVAHARAIDAEYPVNAADKAMREYVYQHKLFIRHPVEGE